MAGAPPKKPETLEEYIRLVEQLADTKARGTLDREEAIGFGMVGLAEALATDETYKGSRRKYISQSITNAILHGARAQEKEIAHRSCADVYGLAVEAEPSIEQLAYLHDHLVEAMKCLSDREQRVLIERCWDGYTLQHVGFRMGVSDDRIRQIEGRALRKLRDKMFKKDTCTVALAEFLWRGPYPVLVPRER